MGTSIVTINDLAMAHGSTSTPVNIRGSTMGTYKMVTIISMNISPTPSERLPLAACTSLTRNGAPATVDSTIKPTCKDGSSGIKRVSPKASSGTSTKFASNARITRRTFLRGWRICATVRASPVPSMPATTNVRPDKAAMVDTNDSSVMFGFLFGREPIVVDQRCLS